MYPVDLEEYFWANGVQQSTVDYLKECFDNGTAISKSIHETMKKLFYSYIVVGGMPQVVQTYVETHDIGRVIEAQRDILDLYRLDIAKYSEGGDKMKIKAIFDSIPAQLNDKNRRFYINSLNKDARMFRYDESFKWLDEAGVALPCYNVTEPRVPLSLNEKHNLFKLFMNDTGLLCAACMDNIQLDILQGHLEINMGSILENVMAQQLRAAGFDLYCYDSAKHGEVDFVIQNGMHIDLAEIKSGSDYDKHNALDNVMDVSEWDFRDVFVFCGADAGRGGNIKYIPWYMIMFLRPAAIPKGSKFEVDISGISDHE
jgi:predicted AAA+ superfamily ATPase